MEASARRKVPALIEALLSEGNGHDFFSAVRRAEAAFGPSEKRDRLPPQIRLRPAPELSFPAAEIRRTRLSDEGRLEFFLNFLGLYGVDTPLPLYWSEAAARDDESSAALRAFLDLFGHRLYELLYFGWKKYRPESGARWNLTGAYLDALGGRAGAPEDRVFCGHLGSRTRSAEGLRGMLEDYIGCPVAIAQFRPRWIPLAGQPSLGSGGEPLTLGENAVLGEQVLDISRRIEAVIGPLSLEAARDLLPGGARAAPLVRLIRRYLPPTVDFEIRLRVQTEAGKAAVLGRDEIALGWNSPLGEQRETLHDLRFTGDSLLRKPEQENLFPRAA